MKLDKIGAINAPQAEPISLRCYTGNYKPASHYSHNDNANNGVMLAFSTETTSDQHQTLTFGSCAVWINGILYKICLFHDESLSQKKVDVIRQAGETIQKEKDYHRI